VPSAALLQPLYAASHQNPAGHIPDHPVFESVTAPALAVAIQQSAQLVHARQQFSDAFVLHCPSEPLSLT
jgi:hypothetical protein